jgi:hypothetical protein
MKKIFVLIGSTAGGYVGWWLGEDFGLMTAFILSMVGTGLGMYAGFKYSQRYTE